MIVLRPGRALDQQPTCPAPQSMLDPALRHESIEFVCHLGLGRVGARYLRETEPRQIVVSFKIDPLLSRPRSAVARQRC
jgi:hypothetical protein